MEAFCVTVQVFTMHTSAFSQSSTADQSEDSKSWAIASDSAWLTLQPNVVMLNFGIYSNLFCISLAQSAERMALREVTLVKFLGSSPN
jgi:hypothetical protein